MQMMGGMPPLPPTNTSAPPPAPPPPDHPPPPPPHENNQPLFGQAPAAPTPAPVPAPTIQNRNVPTDTFNNANFATGNNQNWSYGTEARPDPTVTQPSIINAEALKKLAEEERLFDIQFQKWEEEIDKWRTENVNHPDKQAYKEYEQKFEACRVQLLERRKQMQIKRAQLMNTAPPVANVPKTGNNNNNATVTPPVQQTNNTNYNQNIPLQNYQNKPPPTSGYSNQNYTNQNFSNQCYGNQNYSNQNYSNQKYSNQNYSNQNNSHQNNSQQNSQHEINSQQNTKLQNNSQYNQTPNSGFGRSNNKNVDPQDRYEAYQTTEDYSSAPSEKSSFLPSSGNAKNIPGLDLVPEVERPAAVGDSDVVDITDEQGQQHLAAKKALDYSTISKGINNILGDEKIMNILSMVRGQGTPDSCNQPPNVAPGGVQFAANRNDLPANNQWGNNNVPNNQQYGNKPPLDYDRQGPGYPMHQNQPPQKGMYDRQGNMPVDQNYDRNNQYGNQNMPLQPGPPNMRPNNIPPPRPLMEIVPGQDINTYSRGNDNRGMQPQEPIPPMNQQVKPKWVEDPLFTPSIIVEYEHKPLRLKGNLIYKDYIYYYFIISVVYEDLTIRFMILMLPKLWYSLFFVALIFLQTPFSLPPLFKDPLLIYLFLRNKINTDGAFHDDGRL